MTCWRQRGGLHALAQQHHANVVGGDVGFSPGPPRWTVTALGTLQGPPLRRDAVQPGDQLWLFGHVGQAALGLAALQDGAPFPELIQAHLWPQPLVAQGQLLQQAGVRAAIDISDGLGLDAQRLARASGVDIHLNLPRPDWLTAEIVAWCARTAQDWRVACASGGDDYALLCAAPVSLDLRALGGQLVGSAAQGTGQVTVFVDGERLPVQGFRHGTR